MYRYFFRMSDSYLKSYWKTMRNVSLLLPCVKLIPQIVMENNGKRIVTFALCHISVGLRKLAFSRCYSFMLLMAILISQIIFKVLGTPTAKKRGRKKTTDQNGRIADPNQQPSSVSPTSDQNVSPFSKIFMCVYVHASRPQ